MIYSRLELDRPLPKLFLVYNGFLFCLVVVTVWYSFPVMVQGETMICVDCTPTGQSARDGEKAATLAFDEMWYHCLLQKRDIQIHRGGPIGAGYPEAVVADEEAAAALLGMPEAFETD